MPKLQGAQYTLQLSSRKQKLEEGAHALSPRGFIVFRALDALVIKVVTELPAFVEERVAQHFHVIHNARAFARANVEPDARARFGHAGLRESHDDAVIPPDRGRESGNFSERFRHTKAEIEADETAERGAANSGAPGATFDTICGLNEGHQFIEEKFSVTIGATAAESGHARRGVFANAGFTRVVDADDDHGFCPASENGRIRGIPNMPIHSGNIGRATVEKILAIMQIEDGKMALRLVVVAWGKVNNDAARVAQVPRRKLVVFAKLSSAHGAIVTSRSLASTLCPGATSNFTTRPAMGA